MAITLEGNYSKKIGLPEFSSHQFSLTLKTEINDINQVPQESDRLYKMLQQGVDESIKQVGFLPSTAVAASKSHNNSRTKDEWNCTPKQRELILKIIDENRLDKTVVEKLAQDRYSKGVKELNKLEASALIEELFDQHPRQRTNGHHRPTPTTR